MPSSGASEGSALLPVLLISIAASGWVGHVRQEGGGSGLRSEDVCASVFVMGLRWLLELILGFERISLRAFGNVDTLYVWTSCHALECISAIMAYHMFNINVILSKYSRCFRSHMR